MDHLSAHIQTAEVRIRDVVRCESRLLYTQNKGFLSSKRASYLQLYQDSLKDDKLVGPSREQPQGPAASPSQCQYSICRRMATNAPLQNLSLPRSLHSLALRGQPLPPVSSPSAI